MHPTPLLRVVGRPRAVATMPAEIDLTDCDQVQAAPMPALESVGQAPPPGPSRTPA
jgi:hypothetical protein